MKKAYFNDYFGQTALVIDGTKTQFRQIVPQKALDAWEDIDDGDEYSRSVYADTHDAKMRKFLLKYATYKVGEEVAVAQSYFGIMTSANGYRPPIWDGYKKWQKYVKTLPQDDCAGRHNKMFVKAELMPHRIRIEKIRVERLQDISDADCLAEGILKEHVRLEYNEPQDTVLYSFQNSNKLKPMPKTSLAGYFDSAKAAYAALIDAISGKGTWESNPLVFCYTFKFVK